MTIGSNNSNGQFAGNIMRSALGGAIGVAVTEMPTKGNCLNGTVKAGLLGKAVGYGAAGGVIAGLGTGVLALGIGSAGACVAGTVATCAGAEPETVVAASATGCAVGACGTVVTLFPATGYIAKSLAPSVFTGSAIETGLKVAGGECIALGLGTAGVLGCATLACGPTAIAVGMHSAINREQSAPTVEMMQR